MLTAGLELNIIQKKPANKTTFCTTLVKLSLFFRIVLHHGSNVTVSARHVGGAVLVGELREVLKGMSCPQNALSSEHLSPLLLFRVTGKVGK